MYESKFTQDYLDLSHVFDWVSCCLSNSQSINLYVSVVKSHPNKHLKALSQSKKRKNQQIKLIKCVTEQSNMDERAKSKCYIILYIIFQKSNIFNTFSSMFSNIQKNQNHLEFKTVLVSLIVFLKKSLRERMWRV